MSSAEGNIGSTSSLSRFEFAAKATYQPQMAAEFMFDYSSFDDNDEQEEDPIEAVKPDNINNNKNKNIKSSSQQQNTKPATTSAKTTATSSPDSDVEKKAKLS
jgi:hypothetical protein